MTRILIVDNYDSFVYTIEGYLQQLGAQTVVLRNDQVPDLATRNEFDGIVISPGPGTPKEAGASLQVIKDSAAAGQPLLGICLGHQGLAEVFGGTVTNAPELMHGKTSYITHNGTGVFDSIPSPFLATRYHSLAVVNGTVGPDLEVTATVETEDGPIIMGLAHKTLPLHGVQFHPESILTEHGHRLLANWLRLCGSTTAVAASVGLAPLIRN